jgi:hypothetical protein
MMRIHVEYPIPIVLVLLFVARQELGITTIIVSVLMWFGLLLGFMLLGIALGYFIAVQAILDIWLFLKAFGGDVRIS